MLNGYKIIAVCLSQAYIPKNHEFITELNNLLAGKGFRLFVYNTCCELNNDPGHYNPEEAVYDLVDLSYTDAIVISDIDIKKKAVVEKLIADAHEHNVPALVIDGYRDGVINICYDYEGGFEKMVRHIIEDHKITDVHFMSGVKGNDFAERRLDVFRKVMAENGLPCPDDIISYGDFWSIPARNAAERIVASGHIPRAVICANDLMAINVMSVFREHGYTVPDDVMVTGFDGVMEAFYSVPRLSTCMCSYRRLAEKVAEVLTDVLGGAAAPDYAYVKTTPVLSESCGCSMKGQEELTDYLNTLSDHFFSFEAERLQLSMMSEGMQRCADIKDIPAILKDNYIEELACFINTDCTDRSMNAAAEHNARTFEQEMFLLFNDIEGKDFRQQIFDRRGVLPGLDKVLAQGFPLVFSVISYMQKPIGYVVFYYNSTNIMYYGRIQYTMMMIGVGLGGFVGMQYQQYLADMVEETYRTDNLTGLYNRRGFSRLFEQLCARVSRTGGMITVLLADMDGLKRINDTYGHNAGDNAIAHTALALKSACAENSLCVRFGGDEMLAVMEGDRDEAELRRRYNDYLDRYNAAANNPYVLSVSLGIYKTRPGEPLDFEVLIKKSDELMYKEKQQKKLRRQD